MNCSSASTRSRLRTGYSTKSSRLVALVMRMERISLSLSHPLSPSLILSLTLSFGWTITPIGGFSGKSPKFDPESVPKKLAARHTEDRINHSRQEKILFLPSRDPQNLDLDAMCLDLESSRLPNQEIPGRGNVASIHQHPPTHFPTPERQRHRDKKKIDSKTGHPSCLHLFLLQHPPTHYFPFHPSHRFTSTPSIRRTPPKRSSTPLSHPHHPPPSLQPPNLATSQKTKNASQNRKDGEFVLGSDF